MSPSAVFRARRRLRSRPCSPHARPPRSRQRRTVAGRIALDRLQAGRFFLPVRVLSRLSRRLFLEGFAALRAAGRLDLLRRSGPALPTKAPSRPRSRLCAARNGCSTPRDRSPDRRPSPPISPYTHRVAISNACLIRLDGANGVTFTWKDYRARGNAPGKAWIRPMTLGVRRVHPPLSPPRAAERLPPHPHYGLALRARNIERARQALAAPKVSPQSAPAEANSGTEPPSPTHRCPWCGGRMIVVESSKARRALAVAEPDQDRHFMIDVAALPASQRPFSSPSAARRSRKASPSQDLRILSQRRARARPVHPRDRTSSPSSFPPRTMGVAGPRRDTPEPSAILKSR